MKEYKASRTEGSSGQRGRCLSHPLRRLQEIPRSLQKHGLDHSLPAPEISRDDPRLVRAFLLGTGAVLLRPGQHLVGEARQSGRVARLEAAVGDKTARAQDEDLDHTGLRRWGDDGLHPLSVHYRPGETYPLNAGDQVSQPGGGLELEPRGQPFSLPDERPEVLLATLAAQKRDQLVYDPLAVFVLIHAHARRAASHLAVEADLPITRAPLEREDPAERLDAGVQNPGAPVRTEVDEATLRRVRGDPLGNRVGIPQVDSYEPARLVVPADGVVARQQALYFPGLEDEGVKLALCLPDAHLGDLLDETPYLAASVPPVEVSSDARLQILRLADVESGAVLVEEVVDARRIWYPACQVLLLGFDAAPSPADRERFSDALYACAA